MRPRSSVAGFLAVLVLGYTSFATFLECGMHGAETASAAARRTHHHEHGAPSEHARHEGSVPRGGDPAGPACCRTTLFNAVFQTVSALQLVRAEAFLPVPASLAAVPSADAALTATAGRHWATGPPLLAGPNGTLFPARPRYLVVSSFLV